MEFLEKIFWSDGKFTSGTHEPITEVIIPIGETKIFGSESPSQIMNRDKEYGKEYELERKIIKKHLEEASKKDKSYLEVNAYMIGEPCNVFDSYVLPISFYKIGTEGKKSIHIPGVSQVFFYFIKKISCIACPRSARVNYQLI